MSVLCTVPITWKQPIGKFYNCGISTVISQIKNPRTSREWKFNFLSREVFARQVPNVSCHIICTVQYLSKNNNFVFIMSANKTTSLTVPFGYGKLNTKINKKVIPSLRKREIINMSNQ